MATDDAREIQANQAAQEKIDAPIAEIDAENKGFDAVLNQLRNPAGANVYGVWDALKEVNITRDTPVTVHLRNAPLKKVLTTILASFGDVQAKLTYTLSDGIIVISTKEALQAKIPDLIRVFDARNLLGVSRILEQSKGLPESIQALQDFKNAAASAPLKATDEISGRIHAPGGPDHSARTPSAAGSIAHRGCTEPFNHLVASHITGTNPS